MKKAADQTSRYILLPALTFKSDANTNPKVKSFLQSLNENKDKPAIRLQSKTVGLARPDIMLRVIDSIEEFGPKLIEIREDELADFRFSYPGLRIVPEKFYRKALLREKVRYAITRSATTFTSKLTIEDSSGHPLEGIYVVAFTNFASRTGASGTTNKTGQVTLGLDSSKIQRMYVYPDHTYWGYFKKNFTLAASFRIGLLPIDLAYTDALKHFYDTPHLKKIGHSVRVAVIDTGVGPHKDLVVAGGANMVQGEDPADHSDNGEGHGTHVAGIIGASGAMRGVAAGVKLYSYRVFPKEGGASNFDIMKAIDQASQKDKCDIINLSLGEEELDEGVVSSIKEAYAKGTICFAANGNEDRSPVSFPASYSLSVAVSAMGRKGTFPPNTVQSGIVHVPYGTDKLNFIADFSNIGPETDLTAPGVGIISTYPGDRYAVMDGTSMACPAAVGAAARLLSEQPALLKLPRSQQRSDEMQKFLSTRIQSMGFGANFEGKGMLFIQP